MLGCHLASSALTLLVLLVGAFFLPLSTQIPVNAPGFQGSSRHGAAPPGVRGGAGEAAGRDDEMSLLPKGRAMQTGEEGEEEEEDDELFKDVDPKTLAALLLEALNKPQAERRTDDEGQRERAEGEKTEPAEPAEGEGEAEGRAAERENRDRDGRHELEQVMAAVAAQGREERERQEEEERKRLQEEEERMTERVTSRTTSQTVPVKTEQQASDGAGGAREAGGAGEGAQEGAPAAARTPGAQEEEEEEEEEQLNPEEVQNLERMMKKFQSYSAATKRERDSQGGERESRGGGFGPYNEITKGADLAMSKKKLKWQEETQKAMHIPVFKGGNFMDDFQDSGLDDAGAGPEAARSPAPAPPGNDVMEQDEPEGGEEEGEEEEEEEEVLSPAEEEARAKAEQEEVRRQAAEAQRAKVEEEKLADIASDMLLQYMVKQNGGSRKYGKYSSSSASQSNAAEDKRSDEEQETAADEDDDIDPQTIDKLIEISSKLHLPADDVVDIISDVEKKKKKDVAPEMGSPPPRQRPLMPMSSSQSSSPSINGISAAQMALNNVPLSKQDPLASVNPLKAWFLEAPASKSLLASDDFWTKPQRPLSTPQDFWLKPQKSFRAGYAPYTPYTSYYQQKPYRGYYPIYFPPPPQSAKPRYYVPKPALALNSILGSPAADYDYNYNFGPRRRFRNWVPVRPRKPPASLRRKPYYADYVYSSYPRTFQPAVPVPQLRSPPRLAGGAPRRRSGFYYRPPAPAVTRGVDYYNNVQRGSLQADDADDRLESYIQQILMKRPQMVQ